MVVVQLKIQGNIMIKAMKYNNLEIIKQCNNFAKRWYKYILFHTISDYKEMS